MKKEKKEGRMNMFKGGMLWVINRYVTQKDYSGGSKMRISEYYHTSWVQWGDEEGMCDSGIAEYERLLCVDGI